MSSAMGVATGQDEDTSCRYTETSASDSSAAESVVTEPYVTESSIPYLLAKKPVVAKHRTKQAKGSYGAASNAETHGSHQNTGLG
jgi:hypothetical protein